MNTRQLDASLADLLGISVWVGIKDHPLFSALRNLYADLLNVNWSIFDDEDDERDDDEAENFTDAWPDAAQDWSMFTGALEIYCNESSFYNTVAELTINDDNPWTNSVENGEPPTTLSGLAKADLDRLGRIAGIEIHNLGFHVAEVLRKGGLEDAARNVEEEARILWAASALDEANEKNATLFIKDEPWGNSIDILSTYIQTHGAGFLNAHSSYTWTEPSITQFSNTDMAGDIGINFELVLQKFIPPYIWVLSFKPALNKDPVLPADLSGYESQRALIMANTERFAKGLPANNLLLYGDRGTGKSASVKAVFNQLTTQTEYSNKLKLVELKKNDLKNLPLMVHLLSRRPFYKFIVFIDDLSFEKTNDSFISLKAMLEGGIEMQASNVIIYATSNRRHLVKEAGTNSNENKAREEDTWQEELSLADRFGITIIYTSPSQDDYLQIAQYIAERRGITPDESFSKNALRWAQWFNGRSPRTAMQFVNWLQGMAAGDGWPWS
ncbi:MAG: ATP-binding protein [Spirochaetaceae bacterium]|jgi:predicted AAA+ superfamily ATPase|nr:ATP-binding protein [Spirochaetaceae bacterium]